MNLRLPLLLLIGFSLSGCTTTQVDQPLREGNSHYLFGASALAENNPTVALQEFLLAEKADPKDAEIQSGLAQAYMRKGAYDQAETHFKKAIELSSGAPRYQQNLGALYLTMERYDDAIAIFRKAADSLLFATPERAWTGIGVAQFRKQDYAAAERSYRKALEINPQYAQVLFHQGELYLSQNRTFEAVEAFTRAVELEPRFVESHYQLGLASMKMRDNARARKAFEETIKLAPDSEQARLSRNYLKMLQ